ncbi:hypothetical protein DM02DRAFT_131634 [Periconia macrospinosa]|uniref:Ams2/SPT21 N-terminal domain-containing protein n=1 Tax=Periconia macrospinosa TaxID=97972 RepID=A0A2V1DD66_9PLEO|nr:hypothetical protein DM02DRAFT_131634 [Periconia macrospinosa]
MTAPSSSSHAALQQTSAMSPTEGYEQSVEDIPRRLMRVKVLYTFDDQNKSNCLARLPNAQSIPTIPLDENTQVGVIELKTCIQAVVGASPELVAKLGHDYTVYAYDYSEYETPLVGQGMLSWLLASASPTPNAPADESKTMVTGRVCKNILGLFSNGIKETLEVKLKLVPVPTCMQSEYIENMERYHNLSKVMPQGMNDYNAWAEFLKANPTIRQLAQSVPKTNPPPLDRQQSGGVDSFYDMLTRHNPNDDTKRTDSFHDHHYNTFYNQDTRASSPAMSTASFSAYQHQPYPTRPASQASFHGESVNQLKHGLPSANTGEEEEGPPKKRAHITKAKRPKKTVALGTNTDSLRVTASSAASVRNVRPNGPNPGVSVSVEQVPRAPTPRPGIVGMPLNRGPLRPPAPSLLRNGSIDEGRRPYMSPYDSGIMSDNAMESADEERARSPAETPMTLPSSPPPMPRRTISPARSSPELPSLPPPPPPSTNDSGFVSDVPHANDDVETQEKAPARSESAPAPVTKLRKKADNSKRAWAELTPGPVDLLPQSYTPKLNPYGPYGRPRDTGSIQATTIQEGSDFASFGLNTSADEDFMRSFQDHLKSVDNNANEQAPPSTSMHPPPDAVPTACPPQNNQPGSSQIPKDNAGSPDMPILLSADSSNVTKNISNFKESRARGLPRSHTWSAGEPMSDVTPMTNNKPTKSSSRGPSKGPRKDQIRKKMEEAISAGEMPQYCNNCGQIDTPAWRRAYMRVEKGVPENIQVSSNGTDITAFEVIEPEDDDEDDCPKYRIFKQVLEPDETASDTFTVLTLCNPCGLWLGKKNAMRPHAVWSKTEKLKKKKSRTRKSKAVHEMTMSDIVVPNSEANVPDTRGQPEVPASFDGTVEQQSQSALPRRASSAGMGVQNPHEDSSAEAALLRAIRSSPVGLRGSKDSPIHLDADLTPKPTRRLLFPSPRQPGEKKLLSDNRLLFPPKAQASMNETTGPVTPELDSGEVDKENCPPPVGDEDHELTRFLEGTSSQKTTPTGRSFEDLLKTPTPGSRNNPLTPKRTTDFADITTPSRMMRTPRTSGRAGTAAPETPFTRQLNALLSEGLPSSPSQAIDFSLFPSFNTPGRNHSGAPFIDVLSGDFSSDFPVPSSPPMALGFSVFEDPNTSTVDLWNGAGIFDGNDIMSTPAGYNSGVEHQKPDGDSSLLRMQGLSADFEVLIAQVAGDPDRASGNTKPSIDGVAQSPDFSDHSPTAVTENAQSEMQEPKQAQVEQSKTPEAMVKVESPEYGENQAAVADKTPIPLEKDAKVIALGKSKINAGPART